MSIQTRVIPVNFNGGTASQIVEVGPYVYGALWLPTGFTTANLTFQLSHGADASFFPLDGTSGSITSASAEKVYDVSGMIKCANALKIISASAQTLTAYLILKG